MLRRARSSEGPELTEAPLQSTRFAHSRLAATGVIFEALVAGDAVAKALPRGYAKMRDQLQRALQGAYLQYVEGAARDGADRKARLRCARAEASEAAACLQAIGALHPKTANECDRIVALLDRFAAMVTGLGQLGSS